MPTAMGQAVHLGPSARAADTERDPDGMHDDGAGVAAGGLDHPPRARAQATVAAWTKGKGSRTRLPQIRGQRFRTILSCRDACVLCRHAGKVAVVHAPEHAIRNTPMVGIH